MADDDDDCHPPRSLLRNLIAFWILGLCNNFAYVVMLSAAKDILGEGNVTNTTSECIKNPENIKCSKISTSTILLADIIPSFIVKLCAPFLLHRISYTIRHSFVVLAQTLSFLIVAFSQSFFAGLCGVVFASIGSGLGEVSYLSLSSYFSSDVISSWASGTGGAGIVGSLAFAVLTDRRLLGMAHQTALLCMLVVPFTLFLTFWKLLIFPATVHRAVFWRFETYRIPNRNYESSGLETNILLDGNNENSIGDENEEHNMETPLLVSSPSHYSTTSIESSIQQNSRIRQCLIILLQDKFAMIKPLLKYMVPLVFVYYAEYFINQGLLELFVFVCDKSFHLNPSSQYRWYQVLYQMGVFISRSSVKIVPLHAQILPILSLLQMLNAMFLYTEAFHIHINHIFVLFILIFYEGLLGGAAYANTFTILHKTIRHNREFSMSFVAISDSFGIILAGITGIWAHNYICSKLHLF